MSWLRVFTPVFLFLFFSAATASELPEVSLESNWLTDEELQASEMLVKLIREENALKHRREVGCFETENRTGGNESDRNLNSENSLKDLDKSTKEIICGE